VPKNTKRATQSAVEVWKFNVPDRDYSIASYPLAVTATERVLMAVGKGYYGVVDVLGNGALLIKVAPHSFHRALRPWTELLAELANGGVTVVVDTSNLTDGMEKASIELREMSGKLTPKKPTSTSSATRRIRRPLDAGSAQEWAPTACLSSGRTPQVIAARANGRKRCCAE
jgi:hypothetical protein